MFIEKKNLIKKRVGRDKLSVEKSDYLAEYLRKHLGSTVMDKAICKVCQGSGYIEGIKCIYCTNGKYKVNRKEEKLYKDPNCGEIVEF